MMATVQSVIQLVSFVVLLTVTSSVPSPASRKQPSRVGVDPEVYMDPTQLITSKGYPCENHYITTHDGFILNAQRIPHGRLPQPRSNVPRHQPVVILQHGLLGTSSNWLDNLANESLPYLLADHGADVWLGNTRGNTYSKNHTTLKPDQDEFWDWSYDEMAAFDLPAMIDYVHRVTKEEHMHYVGHSQGTMMAFAAFSTNHTLAAMIKRFYALAPVARVDNIKSPIRKLAPFSKDIGNFLRMFGHGAYDQHNTALHNFLAKDVCKRLGRVLCEDDLFIIGGVDKTSMNMSRVPIYIAHSPGGSSVKNILHFAQGVDSKKFQMFDYGSAEANEGKYGQPTPPQYLPEDAPVPMVIYSAGNDILADPTDVAWLLQKIKPHVLANHYISFWEHLDFIWGFNAPKYCYDDLIKWVFTE